MIYKVIGVEIHSENTAKPTSQPNKALLKWICKQEVVNRVLDFGCGKLRYAGALAKRCHNLTLVDSEIQLNRKQKIANQFTTVREYAKKRWKNCILLNAEEFRECKNKYDLILCANVLSAIPSSRSRSDVLNLILKSLKKNGKCLFVTQFKNSYFSKMLHSKRAKAHLDGWILKTKRGNYYYGIIPKMKLERILKLHGYYIYQSWIKGESVFVLAGIK